MLSGVLRSKPAVAVNIAIMRAFVELRRAASSYAAIERRLEEFERDTTSKLGEHDQHLEQIFRSLRQLISPPALPKRRVGSSRPTTNRLHAVRPRRAPSGAAVRREGAAAIERDLHGEGTDDDDVVAGSAQRLP